MLWKLFTEIIIFYVILVNISLGSCHLNHKNYECILGSKTPYRCVANCDDSELEYSGIYNILLYFI